MFTLGKPGSNPVEKYEGSRSPNQWAPFWGGWAILYLGKQCQCVSYRQVEDRNIAMVTLPFCYRDTEP